MTNAETQLAGYFAKYEPAMAELGRALREDSSAISRPTVCESAPKQADLKR